VEDAEPVIDPRSKMLFGNLLFAIALTVVWPLWMLGLLAACAWLERRTLIPEEVVPRRIGRMDGSTPEAVEAMVFQETDDVVAAYWSTADHPYTGVAISTNGQGRPATTARPSAEQPAAPSEPEPVNQAEDLRVVPSRAARLASWWSPRGRHERR
jgi:hypothetical protein